jgi:glycosyltransferase involved in cell wall biosynthesis
MRILVLIHEIPPVGGGGGRVAQDICRGLAERGHEIRVLTAHLDGLPDREDGGGFEVIRLRSGRKLAYKASLTAMAGYVLSSIWAGLQMVHSWRPDVIHVHFAVPAGPAAFVLSRLTGIPYVLTVHLGDVPGGTPEKTDRWFRWIYPLTPPVWKSAAQVVAVSEFTRQLALKHYPVVVQVIPNGVDLNELNPGEIRVGMPPQIVFAGRFMAQKNPLQVVRTLACLRELIWHCTMLGDGPLRGDVEAEIDRLDLRDRFSLPGWVAPEEVINCFRRSDILFMPSLSEGLPVVGVQALAMGLSIVAGRVGGFVDLVDEQGTNGYLFDLAVPQEAENRLRLLLTDSELLLKQRRASRWVAGQYNLQKIVEMYEAILLKLAKKEVQL